MIGRSRMALDIQKVKMDREARKDTLSVCIFTNEYPPNIYGGAGVHVDYLSRELSALMNVEVRCFGDQDVAHGNLQVKGFRSWGELVQKAGPQAGKVFGPMSTDLAMIAEPISANIVHCHTWYTFWAGFLAKTLYKIPLVVTVHSLEPLRPWKEEQLGGAYRISRWLEETGMMAADRIIAVSTSMKQDILSCYPVAEEKIRIIYNGIDPEEYRPRPDLAKAARQKYGIEGRYILFVGRISRQKGILHLLDAIEFLDPGAKVVLCAGAPDTQELAADLRQRVARLQERVVWIEKMLPREELIGLYSDASVFVCPSVYEPFGIINLEAMGCEVPVVASGVGGIKEVVVDGETGYLVEPGDPGILADAINRLLADGGLARTFGRNGRKRVEDYFSWAAIARKTKEMYEELYNKQDMEGIR